MKDFLTEAFIRIRERLKACSGAILRDNTSAEDSLQEAFLHLWGRYQPNSSRQAEALLHTAVKNEAINVRRRKKEVPYRGDYADEPGNSAEREDLFLWLENTIDKELNDIQKYIIRRHEYEGATLDTIAKELKMQAPAVRKQLSRARILLKEKYHGQG